MVNVNVLVLIIDSEKPSSLVTYACVPSVLMATPVGRLAVGMVDTMAFVAVLKIDTELEFPLVTNP